MKSQFVKSFSSNKKKQILTNALINQFGTSLIPIETVSTELFSDSCIASAISYTEAITIEYFNTLTFHDSARAPNFVLVNDLAEYLLR